jgi:hypothetical protein
LPEKNDNQTFTTTAKTQTSRKTINSTALILLLLKVEAKKEWQTFDGSLLYQHYHSSGLIYCFVVFRLEINAQNAQTTQAD